MYLFIRLNVFWIMVIVIMSAFPVMAQIEQEPVAAGPEAAELSPSPATSIYGLKTAVEAGIGGRIVIR